MEKDTETEGETEAGESKSVHQHPASVTREGVPLQALPVSTPQAGDGCRPEAHRSADQDLIPEPTHETREGP